MSADATYILIGGTGGLGRSMARWMVTQGAKHIVLVSRTGALIGKVKKLVDELGDIGANIVIRTANIVDPESVVDLIENQLQGFPKVKGVIHGAMVLDVSTSRVLMKTS